MTGARNKPHHAPRFEAIAIVAVVLCGAALRFGAASHMAVEHFDEGVYASNIWFDDADGYQYPMRHLYAPVMFPALVEWVMLLCGDDAAMFVNPFVGTLTIVAVWWVARSWFGPVAGIVAAALCATSEFHIAYSRTLLTDPLLCLWMLAAVYCLGEAHRRGDARWMVAGGICTGLAWWTKYNGWLPLAIQSAGVIGWLLFGSGETRTEWKRNAGIIFGAALVAGLVWSPFWYSLRNAGGYAAVAENHRGYLVGLAGWGDSFSRQLQAQRHFDGVITAAGVACAILFAGLFVSRSDELQFRWVDFKRGNPASGPSNRVLWIATAAFAVLFAGMSVAAGCAVLLGMVAVVGIVAWTLALKDSSCEAMNLPSWMLAAWFAGLFVATPLYRAYPRLTLPWLAAAWLGAGAFVSWGVNRLRERSEATTDAPRLVTFSKTAVACVFLAGVVCLIPFGGRPSPMRFSAWQERTGMQSAAHEVLERVRGNLPKGDDKSPIVIFVVGEPALFHHLAAASRESTLPIVVRPVAELTTQPQRMDGKALPTYVITGPHAHRNESFEVDVRNAGARLVPLVPALPCPASDLVLLNEYPAGVLRDSAKRPQIQVRVFRVR